MGSPIPIFEIEDSSNLISSLAPYLPYSLPLLRRLELLPRPGYQTPHSHILASFKDQGASLPFIAAHFDFSHGPDTEMWLFSSLEMHNMYTPADQEMAEQQILSLFEKVNEVETKEAQGNGGQDGFVGARIGKAPGTVMVGSLHEKVLEVLKRKGRISWNTELHQKFVFDGANLLEPIALPSPDLHWNEIQPSHIPLILSRSTIPRQPRLIPLWPSIGIFDTTTTSPIAWTFIGFDGSVKSLYVEEQFRRRGLGKILTLQLFHNNVATLNGGWCHADVAVSNAASMATCESLGGKRMWFVYWAIIKTRP